MGSVKCIGPEAENLNSREKPVSVDDKVSMLASVQGRGTRSGFYNRTIGVKNHFEKEEQIFRTHTTCSQDLPKRSKQSQHGERRHIDQGS